MFPSSNADHTCQSVFGSTDLNFQRRAIKQQLTVLSNKQYAVQKFEFPKTCPTEITLLGIECFFCSFFFLGPISFAELLRRLLPSLAPISSFNIGGIVFLFGQRATKRLDEEIVGIEKWV